MESPDRTARRICDGLIEAGWLVALAVVPVYFNPLSNRSFEPDKIAVLQVLVMVMAGAWLVKIALFRKPENEHDPGRLPWGIMLPVTAFLASAVFSSILSVDSRLSWWGSYLRGQGTVTLLCFAVVFLLAASHLRRIDQWRRVVFVVILTSVAVSLYAVMQGAGTDPLGWAASFRRSSSTLGNPIFLGGYLLMAIFLTGRELADGVASLIGSSGGTSIQPESPAAGVLRVGVLLFAVAIQLIALAQSGSRGPLLGLVAGSFVLLLISALQARSVSTAEPGKPAWMQVAARWSWLAVVAVGLSAVAVLVVAGRFAGPSPPKTPAARLARTFDTESGSARVRTNLWAAVLEMMRSPEPLQLLPDVADPRHPARRLVGYGPETFQLAVNRFLPQELVELGKRGSIPDRAHNAVLDQLAATGLVGLVSWFWLMASVLLWGSRGLLPAITVRQQLLFWLVAGGSVAVAVASSVVLTGSWLWAGMAAPAGLALAAATFLTVALMGAGRPGGSAIAGGPRAAISAVVVATVTAHLIESSFSFTTAATGLYFWVLAAAGAAVACGRMTVADAGSRQGRGTEAGRVLTRGLLAATVCVTLLFGFTAAAPAAAGPTAWFTGGGWRVIALTLGTAVLLALTGRGAAYRLPMTRSVLVVTTAGAVPTLAFAALLHIRAGAASATDPTLSAARISWLPVDYIWFVLILAVAIGAATSISGRRYRAGRSVRVTATALAAVIALAALAAPRILRTVRADVFAKFAGAALDRNRPPVAVELARRAVDLAPLEDALLSLAGRAAVELATVEDVQTRALAHLELGERFMVRAVETRPLNPDHVANLARLQVLLSEKQPSQERRQWLEEQAGAGFERALQLRPGSAEYLAGLGGLMLRRGELEPASAALAEAVRRDGRYLPAVLALAQCHQVMAEEASAAGDPGLALSHRSEARRVLEQAVRSNPDSDPLRSALAALSASDHQPPPRP